MSEGEMVARRKPTTLKEKLRNAEYMRRRYREDPVYRERKKKQSAEHSARNREWRRAYDTNYKREYHKKIRTEKPYLLLARRELLYAYRDGRLTKKPCEICGDPRSEGHHWSYLEEHWTDVQFLCRKHHEAWHRVFEVEVPLSSSSILEN